jgi:hypothetical protein
VEGEGGSGYLLLQALFSPYLTKELIVQIFNLKRNCTSKRKELILQI